MSILPDYSKFKANVLRCISDCTSKIKEISAPDNYEGGSSVFHFTESVESLDKVLRQKLLFSPRLEYLYASILASYSVKNSVTGSTASSLEDKLHEFRKEKERTVCAKLAKISQLTDDRNKLDCESRKIVGEVRKKSFKVNSDLIASAKQSQEELENKLKICLEELEALEEEHKNTEEDKRRQRRDIETEVYDSIKVYDSTMNDLQNHLQELVKQYHKLIEDLELQRKLCDKAKEKHDEILQIRRKEEEQKMAEAQDEFRREHSARIIQRAWQHYKIKKMLKKAKKGRKKKHSITPK